MNQEWMFYYKENLLWHNLKVSVKIQDGLRALRLTMSFTWSFSNGLSWDVNKTDFVENTESLWNCYWGNH